MVAFDAWKLLENDNQVRCQFCARTVADVDEAVEAGWIPSYYDYDDHEHGPACPTCVKTRLVLDATTSTYEVVEWSN